MIKTIIISILTIVAIRNIIRIYQLMNLAKINEEFMKEVYVEIQELNTRAYKIELSRRMDICDGCIHSKEFINERSCLKSRVPLNNRCSDKEGRI